VIRLQASFPSSPGGAGTVRTRTPCDPVQIILKKELTKQPEVSIKGKALPNLAGLSKGLSQVQTGTPLLVCLLDIEQRPSRRCLADLAKQASVLSAKGVQPIVVQTTKVDLKPYVDFLKANSVTFEIHTVDGDFEASKAKWGAKALPWLILTDKDHQVTAEGFEVAGLGKQIRD
jgi:hypothetical protein